MTFCPSCGARLPGPPPVVCSACNAEHWRNSKPTAGALVVERDRLLLVRRSHGPFAGCWDIPGGFCDVDEHPALTAIREVREEAGLAVRITGLLGIWMDAYDPADRTPTALICMNVYYHALLEQRVGNPDPKEVSELAWFQRDHLPNEIAFPGHAHAVLEAWRRAPAAVETQVPLPDVPG